MRKQTINYIYDLLYYAFFSIVPIVAFLVYCNHHDNATLISFFSEFGILSNNVIFSTLVDMFGQNGYLPLIEDTSTLFYLFTYMLIVVLMHLVFDIIAFIPKLSHHYLNKYCKECE